MINHSLLSHLHNRVSPLQVLSEVSVEGWVVVGGHGWPVTRVSTVHHSNDRVGSLVSEQSVCVRVVSPEIVVFPAQVWSNDDESNEDERQHHLQCNGSSTVWWRLICESEARVTSLQTCLRTNIFWFKIIFIFSDVWASSKLDTSLSELIIEVSFNLLITLPSPPQPQTARFWTIKLQRRTLVTTLRLWQKTVLIGSTSTVVVGFANIVPVREEPSLIN